MSVSYTHLDVYKRQVNTNPDNPVIGTRAFSSEPQTAADLVGGACAGFADAGIACTLKHFPGHGDTSEDTHVGTVTLNKTLDDLRSCELVPFAQNVNNAPLIMAAHITVPQVTGDDTPASLSSVMPVSYTHLDGYKRQK